MCNKLQQKVSKSIKKDYRCTRHKLAIWLIHARFVVYLDQLLGAVRTWRLENTFLGRFQPFLFIFNEKSRKNFKNEAKRLITAKKVFWAAFGQHPKAGQNTQQRLYKGLAEEHWAELLTQLPKSYHYLLCITCCNILIIRLLFKLNH